MSSDVQAASDRRMNLVLDEEVDRRITLLLSNYQRVTANPRSMGYLRFLLRHYAKMPHPWRQCYADNLKRFGPEKTAALCGVLKDTIRQTTFWRGKSGHSRVADAGAPGVVIGEADAGAAQPAWHGGSSDHLSEERPISLLDELDMAFGVTDHSEPIYEAVEILCALGEVCDPYRVIVGLDSPPIFKEAIA